MVVNPLNGSVYVSNTETRNHVRFEGSGERGSTVRGHFVESRITVIKDDKVEPQLFCLFKQTPHIFGTTILPLTYHLPIGCYVV